MVSTAANASRGLAVIVASVFADKLAVDDEVARIERPSSLNDAGQLVRPIVALAGVNSDAVQVFNDLADIRVAFELHALHIDTPEAIAIDGPRGAVERDDIEWLIVSEPNFASDNVTFRPTAPWS